jgi:uncharacterized protein (DUF58 family)
VIDPLFGFDGDFLDRLARLSLLARRPVAGPSAGPRRSPRHGASVEFADFRAYIRGDDFRRVDWNAYARLGKLFLRLYRAEEMSTLTLFLDHSRSMRFGEPSKALTAARLAAIFSYLALQNDDRVAVAAWGDSVDGYLPPQSGKAAIPRVWRRLAEMSERPAAGTDLSAIRRFSSTYRARGLGVVITDLMTESDWQSALRSLTGAGLDVSLIQILAPEELNPSLRGDWKLRDSETGASVEVTISPRVLRRYEDELAAHTETIRAYCRRLSIPYLQIPSDAPLLEVAVGGLRNAGVLG